MSIMWSSICAFMCACVFTGLELLTSRYPNTWFLVVKKLSLYLYCGIYGFFALFGFLFFDRLMSSGTLRIDGFGLESSWGRAIFVGLFTKAIMQLNLYTITSGTSSMPIGLQTIVQIFEPYLLRQILLDEFNAVRQLVRPIASKAKYKDINQVRDKIRQNIPETLSPQERVAFLNEIDKDLQVHEAMERFLRFLGKSTFKRVFPD